MKVLVCNRKEHRSMNRINIGEENVQELQNFRYLGSQIKTDGKSPK